MEFLRKKYTDQFKEEDVKLAESFGATKAARDLGIEPSNINGGG